ncbi:MAG: MTH1187 family thiamine-binding protein [Chloroflexi bacterium]|nr:MTH1187 family thiamine-binding protein [Chloroflexota bacterium]
MSRPVLAELSVVPIGVGPSLSRYVASCIKVLDEEPAVTYELTAMGTIILGPLDAVLHVARRLHEVPFAAGALRVVTTLKIDDRRDKQVTLRSKVASVLEKKTAR